MRQGSAERVFWALSQPRIVVLLGAVIDVPGRSTSDLAGVAGITPNLASSLLNQLRRQHLLARDARQGTPGNIAMWRATPLGRTVFRHAAAIRVALAQADL